MELREKLKNILTSNLVDSYFCNRVWPAWSYGTMTEDDFEPVNETDNIYDIINEIEAITSVPKHETVEQWVERFKDMPGLISIDLLFHKDGTHITKQEYGRILINTICNELIEKYGKPEGNR
ncbi:MAG: hypothetical protein GY804_02745 [Alphaproteobacteria bacterium]|nr:hypothetical protein [Alphaproteobacteria bacterium]